jgi:hypothetical protein
MEIENLLIPVRKSARSAQLSFQHSCFLFQVFDSILLFSLSSHLSLLFFSSSVVLFGTLRLMMPLISKFIGAAETFNFPYYFRTSVSIIH